MLQFCHFPKIDKLNTKGFYQRELNFHMLKWYGWWSQINSWKINVNPGSPQKKKSCCPEQNENLRNNYLGLFLAFIILPTIFSQLLIFEYMIEDDCDQIDGNSEEMTDWQNLVMI